ncbi:MAG: ATP-binding protein [Woeseia sp.]
MNNADAEALRRENERLRRELQEAEETIHAIRDGRVDAFVVGRNAPDRVYTLESGSGPYRVLVEHMQQGAVTVAVDGTILYANGRFSTLLGRSREHLVGRSFRDLVAESGRSQFDALIAGEVDSPQGEIRLERPDGTLVPVYISANDLSAEDASGVCMLVTDLTRQKQHEELIAAETLARSMLQQAADPVVVCDPDGRVAFASPAAHEICGQNPLGKPFMEMFPLTLARTSPLAPDGRFELDRLDGPIRGLEATLSPTAEPPLQLLLSAGPVTDGMGAALGSVVTLADIGALKRAEAALKKADRRKDEFLAVLAHELRNPLAPIVTGLTVLGLADDLGENSAGTLQMVERQVRHLTRLVDDLLEISRVTLGKIELRKEVLDLAKVVSSALDTIRPRIEESQHSVAVDLPKEPIRLEADGVRLAQVIANLLHNAAKFTPPGGDISLKARVEETQLILRVRDSGRGIEADVLPGVFDMFSQSRRSRQLNTGLGIGLALVRTLVQMHGGSVSAASDGIDRGSEFTVRLPLGDTTRAQSDDGPVRGANAGRRQRVLVVDDNEDSATSLGMLLNIMDYEVKVAFDGESALAELGSFRPQAIFLDIDMPVMDGYEVARRIRERGVSKELMLIALTGWGQESDRRQTRNAGFDHHLLKPVDIEALRSVLTTAG